VQADVGAWKPLTTQQDLNSDMGKHLTHRNNLLSLRCVSGGNPAGYRFTSFAARTLLQLMHVMLV